MDIKFDKKCNIRRNIVDFGLCGLLIFINSVHADLINDRALSKKFAPIFILTTNPERTSRIVLNPEPVEIIGANSMSNLWLSAYGLDGTSFIGEYPISANWVPTIDDDYFPDNVSFSQKKFAFLNDDEIDYSGVIPSGLGVFFKLRPHFNYPGNDKNSWNAAYLGDGAHAGWRFSNTVYAHVFERDSSDDYGSVVIKYLCFYPFNDWRNDHEGDWPKVNVMVTSRDHRRAEFHRIDYIFHGKSITYHSITNSPSSIDVQQRISPVGERYPVVYVRAGGHGHYPTLGNYENAPKRDIPHENGFHNFPIVGDVTWSGNISLKGDIVIFPGATLTVQPGTVVEFEPETDIHQFTPSYSGPTSTITETTTLHYEPPGSDALRPRLVIDHTRAEIYVYGTLISGEETATDSIRFRQKSVPTWTGDYAWGGIRKMRGGSTAFHHTEVRDTRRPESRPTNPRAEAGDGQVTLTWGDAYPEDPSISGWEYRRRVWEADLAEDAGWGSWTAVSGGGDMREVTVGSLAHGKMHQFQVRAVNSTGAGPASKSVKVALMQVSYSAETYEAVEPNPEGTTEGLPAQVTVRLTPAADRRVSIPITVTEGAAESGDYTVSGLGSGNLLDFVGGDNSKRFTIEAESDTEMESGETLELGFGAALPVGVRSGTPSTATVTLSESGTPGTIPPTLAAGLAASSTAAGQIRVVWDASTDMTVSGYTLRFQTTQAGARDSDGDPIWAAWPVTWNLCPLPALGVDATDFPHEGLPAWRLYRYQVQATNPHGDSEWSESFPPSGVTPVGGASGTSGASGARGTSSGGATATSVRVEAAGDTVRVSGLADTVVHQIRVRLVNADGVPGVASDSVAVVPLRAQAGDGQVTLSWDDPGNDTLEEWQYRQQRGRGSWGEWQDVPAARGRRRRTRLRAWRTGRPTGSRCGESTSWRRGVTGPERSRSPGK